MQPSRQLLHVQFKSPVKSSRRVVTHNVGRSIKSPARVESAGSEIKIKVKNSLRFSGDEATYQRTKELEKELTIQLIRRRMRAHTLCKKYYALSDFFL